MRAVVINLDGAKERMAFQHRQLKRLKIDFERISANSTSYEKLYEKYHNVWERPLSYAEISCFFNHKKVWEMIVEENSPLLVLEDDACIAENASDLIDKIRSIKDMDYLNLEARGNGQRKLISKKTQHNLGDVNTFRLFQGRSGTGGYVLWPSGAKKLLSKFNKGEVGIVDKYINSSYSLKSFQLEPAIVIQIDRCEHYGLAIPIETNSYIGLDNKTVHARAQFLSHKIRRLKGQIEVALNRFRHCHLSEYRAIRISSHFLSKLD